MDPRTLMIEATAFTGGQPLEAVVLRNGRVIARDWKTRRVLDAAF